MPGRVEWIGIRPQRKATVLPVKHVRISTDSGLEGDHETQPHRQVTLIQAEKLYEVAAELGHERIDPASTRRNILVSGLDFDDLKGKKLNVGTAVIEVTGLCHPCTRMDENLGDGGRSAMAGKGGLTAKVLSSGEVGLGDMVEVV